MGRKLGTGIAVLYLRATFWYFLELRDVVLRDQLPGLPLAFWPLLTM